MTDNDHTGTRANGTGDVPVLSRARSAVLSDEDPEALARAAAEREYPGAAVKCEAMGATVYLTDPRDAYVAGFLAARSSQPVPSVSAEREALATIGRLAQARATTDRARGRSARGWLDVLAVIERVQP